MKIHFAFCTHQS